MFGGRGLILEGIWASGKTHLSCPYLLALISDSNLGWSSCIFLYYDRAHYAIWYNDWMCTDTLCTVLECVQMDSLCTMVYVYGYIVYNGRIGSLGKEKRTLEHLVASQLWVTAPFSSFVKHCQSTRMVDWTQRDPQWLATKCWTVSDLCYHAHRFTPMRPMVECMRGQCAVTSCCCSTRPSLRITQCRSADC